MSIFLPFSICATYCTLSKTIVGDLALLSEMDVDVITIKGRQNRYFIGSRPFELAEIRLLIDAVSSCRFITARKSTALIQKLKSLTSRHAAANLEQHLHIAEQIKSTNESVFYTVDAITNAIYSGHKITFQYLEYRQDRHAEDR